MTLYLRVFATLSSTGKDVDQLARLVSSYSKDSRLGNVEEVTDVGNANTLLTSILLMATQSYLDAHRQLSSYVTSECALMAEIEVISAALQGKGAGIEPVIIALIS